jgi:hypothetical protein
VTSFLRVRVLGHEVPGGCPSGGGVAHDHVGIFPLGDAPGAYVFDN